MLLSEAMSRRKVQRFKCLKAFSQADPLGKVRMNGAVEAPNRCWRLDRSTEPVLHPPQPLGKQRLETGVKEKVLTG